MDQRPEWTVLLQWQIPSVSPTPCLTRAIVALDSGGSLCSPMSVAELCGPVQAPTTHDKFSRVYQIAGDLLAIRDHCQTKGLQGVPALPVGARPGSFRSIWTCPFNTETNDLSLNHAIKSAL